MARALAEWTTKNPQTGALVWRLTDDVPQRIAASRATTGFAPASTMKIVTAANALAALGPDTRFETRLVAGASATNLAGILTGPLYVKGYGDPVLSTPAYARRHFGGVGGNLGRLVAPLRKLGVTQVRGPIVVDESYLDDTRRGPLWKASYRFESGALTALSINEGFAADTQSRGYIQNPPIEAARRIQSTMRVLGITHTGPLREGVAPELSRPIGSVLSPPLSQIVGLMLPPSNNFIAETLTRSVGARTGGTGTTAEGAAQATNLLASLGAAGPQVRVVDGSGLSRANRLTADSLVRLLATADGDPTWGPALVAALPHGGEGTLKRRLRGPNVAKRVRAKTGTISGVSSLAGLVTSRGGERYAFAILMYSGSNRAANRAQDRIVTLLASGAADALVGQPAYSPAIVPPPPSR